MKRKINIDRKPLASEEINATKDFGSLMNKMAGMGSVSPKLISKSTGWFIGSIAAIVIATGIYLGTKEVPSIPVKLAIKETIESDSIVNKPIINPAIPEADIANESYFVNAKDGGKIKHHTGTEITIPEGAFMDEKGNVITGKVEIQYREFHDQADIYLSGIPMEYDTAGNKKIFESAGMMEIRGFQNGKRLKIVPDKNFVICMHSKNPDPKFNLYYLDEEKKKWNYEGKDSIALPSKSEIDTRYPTISSSIENPSNKIMLSTEKKINETQEEIKEIKKEIVKIKKTKPSEPRKANPNKKNFTIDVVKSEYPELAVYTGTVFEVINNDNLPEDTYQVTWNDVALKEKNNTYSIELSKGKRTEEIAVIPVLEGKDYGKARKVFDAKFSTYTTLLTKKKEEEKNAIEDLSKLKEKYKKEQEEYEKSLLAIKASMRLEEQSNLELQRVFNINRFGTWNCDSPIPYPKGMTVRANYQDGQTGKPIEFRRLDLIEKSRNACFPIYAEQLTKLPFNPRKENILWGVTDNGMIAVATNDQFKKIRKKNERFTFTMKIIDIQGKSTAEIKQLLTN